TTNPFTVTGLQPLTKYTVYVRTMCSATDMSSWRQAEDDINTMCNYPELIIAPDVTVCGSQEVDLTAIFDSGTVYWYDSVTQDSLLHTGANFKTPFLTSNTSYWVQAGDAPNSGGGPKANVGPIDNTIGATGTYTAMNHWMLFTVNSSTTIYSVDVFANGAGLVDVLIQDGASGATLFTPTVAVSGSGLQTIVLDQPLAPGDYRMAGSTVNNAGGLQRNSAGATYPYVSTDGSITITGNSFSAAAYYFFYNWQ